MTATPGQQSVHGLFTIIPTAQVILRRSNGTYLQVKMAERSGYIYAVVGSTFIRLEANHATSCPTIRWEEVDDIAHVYIADAMGRMKKREQ